MDLSGLGWHCFYLRCYWNDFRNRPRASRASRCKMGNQQLLHFCHCTLFSWFSNQRCPSLCPAQETRSEFHENRSCRKVHSKGGCILHRWTCVRECSHLCGPGHDPFHFLVVVHSSLLVLEVWQPLSGVLFSYSQQLCRVCRVPFVDTVMKNRHHQRLTMRCSRRACVVRSWPWPRRRGITTGTTRPGTSRRAPRRLGRPEPAAPVWAQWGAT